MNPSLRRSLSEIVKNHLRDYAADINNDLNSSRNGDNDGLHDIGEDPGLVDIRAGTTHAATLHHDTLDDPATMLDLSDMPFDEFLPVRLSIPKFLLFLIRADALTGFDALDGIIRLPV